MSLKDEIFKILDETKFDCDDVIKKYIQGDFIVNEDPLNDGYVFTLEFKDREVKYDGYRLQFTCCYDFSTESLLGVVVYVELGNLCFRQGYHKLDINIFRTYNKVSKDLKELGVFTDSLCEQVQNFMLNDGFETLLQAMRIEHIKYKASQN